MSKEFHPITDKHGRQLSPTRHDVPLAERYSIAVLRCLHDVSQPTTESETKTAHVSCHETGACIILTVPSAKGAGDKRVRLEAGGVTMHPLLFDSFDQFSRSKMARGMVDAFVDACRVRELQESVA